MNIFKNADENRIRAGWRLAGQLFLMYLIGFVLFFLISRIVTLSGQFVSTVAICTGAVVSIILAARGLDLRKWEDYGLIFNYQSFKQGFLGFALAGLVMGIIFLIEYAAGWLTVSSWGWQASGNAPYLLSLGTYFLWMVIVGFYEELVFRGYQLVNLSEGLNIAEVNPTQAIIGATVLSSLIFGVMHAPNPNANWIALINIALAGGMLAFPFIITGRLSLSIGLHIGWNFFQGGIFGFPVSGLAGRASLIQINQQGPVMLTGGSFGPEAGVLGLMGMLLVIIGVYIYFKQTKQQITIHTELATYTPLSSHKWV